MRFFLKAPTNGPLYDIAAADTRTSMGTLID